ncbi:hypothetical protein MA16_Dca004894 [Dendrobium catenatum]|uniref:Uncharacterized protein n=1 Tax=Dendrobium catenatum TaxID=906689 RepID=A0A2I0WGC4_9ASPA|nr:hypothetical protein MA16_Dca004894 [Dendrobium catenatum]
MEQDKIVFFVIGDGVPMDDECYQKWMDANCIGIVFAGQSGSTEEITSKAGRRRRCRGISNKFLR